MMFAMQVSYSSDFSQESSMNMTDVYVPASLSTQGHFDETLGADFFLFSETAFLEIYTSKISGQNIE